MQLYGEQVVPTLGAQGRPVASELLFLGFLLLVASLDFFDLRGQSYRLNACRGSLSPGATPSTDGAAERLFHGAHSGSMRRPRASSPGGLVWEADDKRGQTEETPAESPLLLQSACIA